MPKANVLLISDELFLLVSVIGQQFAQERTFFCFKDFFCFSVSRGLLPCWGIKAKCLSRSIPFERCLQAGLPEIYLHRAACIPGFGIRSRAITPRGDLYFKVKPHWLSGVYSRFVRDLCLSAWTLASVATKDCSCQNRRREGGLKGLLLFCLAAVNRCIREITARQDAVPHLQQKEQPIPNLGMYMPSMVHLYFRPGTSI